MSLLFPPHYSSVYILVFGFLGEVCTLRLHKKEVWWQNVEESLLQMHDNSPPPIVILPKICNNMQQMESWDMASAVYYQDIDFFPLAYVQS